MPSTRPAVAASLPYWKQLKPTPEHDIVKLRPRTLPRGQRFESRSDAKNYTATNLARLLDLRWARSVSRTIDGCREHDPCCSTLCARCARAFRRWLIGEELRLLHPHEGDPSSIVTVLLERCSGSGLRAVSLAKLKDRVRARFRGAGLSKHCVIGGFEAAFRVADGDFVVHLHIGIANLSASEANAKLSHRFSRDGLESAFVAQPLRDPVRQLSYLFKAASYHRPAKQTGQRKSRAFPMPDDAFADWARWQADLSFEDLLFLHGCRRRGSRLVPLQP